MWKEAGLPYAILRIRVSQNRFSQWSRQLFQQPGANGRCLLGLQEAGMELDPSLLLKGNYSRRSGIEAATIVADRLHEIDAVFAANDRMAIGVMHGLRERGIGPADFPGICGL